MEQEGSTMKPAKDATSDETLADIEESTADELGETASDDVVSPDGGFDEDEESKTAEP